MQSDVPLVGIEGARLHPRLDARQPVFVDPLGERRRTRFNIGSRVGLVNDLRSDGFSFSSRAEAAMPLLVSLPAGISWQVDHDVPGDCLATRFRRV